MQTVPAIMCERLIGAMVFDARLLLLFLNTGKLALMTVLVSLPVAMLLAFLLSRRHVAGRRCWEACLLVLLFMPLYTNVAAWEAGFGQGGWYSTLIAGQLTDPPLVGMVGATWVHAMAAIPWMYWLLRLSLHAIPVELDEAAQLDGAAWRGISRITLPLALPGVIAAILLVVVSVCTEITVTDVYQVRTYAEELYNGFVLGAEWSDLPLRAAPIILFMWLLVACGITACYCIWPAATGAAGRARSQAREIDWLATAVVLVCVAVLLFVPLGNLFYQAGIDVMERGGQRERVWSLIKVVQVLARSPFQFQRELAWTAMLSELSAVLAVVAAGGLAVWSRRGILRQWLAALLAVAVYALPGPFIGLGIIWLLNRPRYEFLIWLYDDTLFAPWLALCLRAFPFAYLTLAYGLHAIPREVLEAAEVDGAGRWHSLRYVVLPLMIPSILCAALVSTAVAVADLSASVLVMPPGVSTVSSRIFNLVHYGAEDSLAGLCLTNMLLMSLLALLTHRVILLLHAPHQATAR